jgi:hypothetical protein
VTRSMAASQCWYEGGGARFDAKAKILHITAMPGSHM